jgi:hypothetical protein
MPIRMIKDFRARKMATNKPKATCHGVLGSPITYDKTKDNEDHMNESALESLQGIIGFANLQNGVVLFLECKRRTMPS